MSTLIRIGVLYAAPAIAILAALVAFVVLLRRVRRGALHRTRAAWLYSTTLLLPVLVVIVIWGVGELASYFAVASDLFAWDAQASLGFLLSLLPLGGYVAAPIALLVLVFWAIMAGSRRT